jgi:hypothetical protein
LCCKDSQVNLTGSGSVGVFLKDFPPVSSLDDLELPDFEDFDFFSPVVPDFEDFDFALYVGILLKLRLSSVVDSLLASTGVREKDAKRNIIEYLYLML